MGAGAPLEVGQDLARPARKGPLTSCPFVQVVTTPTSRDREPALTKAPSHSHHGIKGLFWGARLT